jgi:isopenicillin N synthase-like dioxygenase
MSSQPSIPIIDIAGLITGHPEGEREVARLVGRACRDIGFFLHHRVHFETHALQQIL